MKLFAASATLCSVCIELDAERCGVVLGSMDPDAMHCLRSKIAFWALENRAFNLLCIYRTESGETSLLCNAIK